VGKNWDKHKANDNNPKMQKKRINHRLVMIAPDKVMILGGFN